MNSHIWYYDFMRILEEFSKEAHKDKVRLIHLGRKDRIPKSFAQTLSDAEKETLKNEKQ